MADVRELFDQTIRLLNKYSIKHEVHHFDSGAIMVDIWFRDEFYVVQLAQNLIGLSQISERNPGFDTRPDHVFKHVSDFKKSLLQVLEKNDQEFLR